MRNDQDCPLKKVLLWRASTVVIVALLAVALRFYRFNATPFGPDEYWAIYLATGHGDTVMRAPLNQILPAFRVDFADPATSWHNIMTGLSGVLHPPFYYLAMRAWALIIGENDYQLRLFSGICSALCVPAMYLILRQDVDWKSSLFGAALMACAWSQIEFSQQARPYALVMLLSLSCLGALRSIESRSSVLRLVWLTVSVALLCLTHYFAAGAILAMLIYAFCSKAARPALRNIILGIIIAGFIWLPFALHSIGEYRQIISAYTRNTDYSFYSSLSAPARLLLHDPSVFCVVSIAALLAIAATTGGRAAMLWTLWLVLSLGFVAIYDIAGHSNLASADRYVVIAFPGIVGLLATASVKIPAKLRPVSVLILLSLLLGVACDGFNRCTEHADFTQYVWYHTHLPCIQADKVIFAEAPDYPGCQPLDYIAYRRQHPELAKPIMFTPLDKAATRY